MSEQTLSVPAPVQPVDSRPSAKKAPVCVPRLLTGDRDLGGLGDRRAPTAPAYVAKPSNVVMAIPRVITDPAFLSATGNTLLAVAEGLAIAFVIGPIVGLLMGRSPALERVIRALHQRLLRHANDRRAAAVLAVVRLFRRGAARDHRIRRRLLDHHECRRRRPRGAEGVSRSRALVPLRPRAPLFEIVLPASTPYLLAGFRLAAGRALIGAVVAEFFLAVGGLGYYILYNSRVYHHNEAFVGVLLLAAFGVGFELLVQVGTRRFMPWYRRDEKP